MADFPTKDRLIAWIQENPHAVGKREIARAFSIKGAARVDLKRILRELEDEGHIQRHRRRLVTPGHLPPVSVLIIDDIDAAGELIARPAVWESDQPAPRILYTPRRGDPALGVGARLLARLRPVADGQGWSHEARLIKRLGDGPRRMLGIYRQNPEGGRLLPVDKKADHEWIIPSGAQEDARDGELVEAELIDAPRFGLPQGKIVERHGDPGAPRQVSLIAMVQHQIPYVFSPEVLAEAEAERPCTDLRGREDLRHLPLITIDPADARDHDDAVCAMEDDDPANPGGHVVWVAIADVAAHVRPGSALDREARRRGNSCYFPDRVSPMLPERLSSDLCSLLAGVDRACLAVRMVLDAEGNKINHRFCRALMRSPATLSYQQVQAIQDGRDGDDPELAATVIAPLYRAYHCAARARDRRQPLDLDLPERQITLAPDGSVGTIALRERLDAHRLIEEFMILANVCAAQTLETRRRALFYRVHEPPHPDKLDALRETVEPLGLTLAKGGQLRTAHLNRLLHAAKEGQSAESVQISVLRAQTQAYYATENFGHFGLNLARYTHFTSPIRRYADLIVHRALIAGLGLGDDGLTPDEIESLPETAEHISKTERRAMMAERDTTDRYVAAYLAGQQGAHFTGSISGIARFGLFIRLDETGADGLVPVRSLGREYFQFDAARQTLRGQETGRVLGLGQRVEVRLLEATPLTGGLIFELLSVEGTPLGRARTRRGKSGGKTGATKAPPRRKLAQSRLRNKNIAKSKRPGK